MTSQGILFIGRAISKLHDLEGLSLRFIYCKKIGENNAKCLCQSLKGLKWLQVLYLNFEGSTSDELEEKVVNPLKNSLPFLKKNLSRSCRHVEMQFGYF